MKEIFNEDFVKFLLGFLVIVTVTLGIILVTEQVMDNDTRSSSDSIQVLPATTTTNTP
ncbi:MAG: hypothetical protein WD335_03925 [Candidatus Paceibacterota bacterium]